MQNYKVKVSLEATYIIRCEDAREAKNLAWELFDDCDPDFDIEETDEEPELTVGHF